MKEKDQVIVFFPLNTNTRLPVLLVVLGGGFSSKFRFSTLETQKLPSLLSLSVF